MKEENLSDFEMGVLSFHEDWYEMQFRTERYDTAMAAPGSASEQRQRPPSLEWFVFEARGRSSQWRAAERGVIWLKQ